MCAVVTYEHYTNKTISMRLKTPATFCFYYIKKLRPLLECNNFRRSQDFIGFKIHFYEKYRKPEKILQTNGSFGTEYFPPLPVFLSFSWKNERIL